MDFIEKFCLALKIPTYWPKDAGENDESALSRLTQFQELLVKLFPEFNAAAEKWVLNPFMLICRLPGISEKNASLFLAHYDVVPAETGKWSIDPFGAELKDGFIYGRGSLDMKQILIGIMEAAENLCREGFKPKNDIWFAFGGDEERAGTLGAARAVEWFRSRGVRFNCVFDEGTPIAKDHIKGIDRPLALVSVAEKGYLSLKLAVAQEPGHSSRPPKIQAAAVLGRALCRIAKKPFPYKLTPAVETFFRQIAPFMPPAQGFVMRHARAFGPLFFKLAASSPTVESMMRTTVAITQLQGSAADNVLPSEASAVINLRLLEPWTIETAILFIRKAVNDKRVSLNIHQLAANPTPEISPAGGKYGWQEIQTAMKEIWPDIPVLPFLMVATTDSRHYKELTDNIYRFSPYILDPDEMGGVHGHDERISLENLRGGLAYYKNLMRLL